jgi:LPS sulfotransferase NodH
MKSAETRVTKNRQPHGTSLFVLVSSQRSGTNFFRELMNTHPRVLVHGELAMPWPSSQCYHTFARTALHRSLPPLTEADATAVLDDYLVYLAEESRRAAPDRLGGGGVIGLDLKYNQLRFVSPLAEDLGAPPFVLKYLRSRGVLVVHLVRENVAHQAMSLTIAEQRGVYHNYGGHSFDDRLRVDPARFLTFCNWVQMQSRLFRELGDGLHVHQVSYESLVSACETAKPRQRIAPGCPPLAALAQRLGVADDFGVPSTINKVINRPYSEILENHAEIIEALQGSEFREFAPTL